MRKVERLVNLIALLLNTRRPLTVEEIRNTVPGYQQEDYSSFKRMFERDKEELRAVGIPIERRFTDVWEVEEGYLISKDRYYLPELELTPEEVAALWIASQVVVEAGGKEDQALMKLSLGAGMGTDPSSPPWLRARLHLDAPALPLLLEAVAAKRTVAFAYRAAGRTEDVERRVDPYALVHRQGAWYLVGHDHLRDELRHFKLQRVTSDVAFVQKGPGPDFEARGDLRTGGYAVTEPWVGEEGTPVEVAFSPRIAWWVEQALGLEPIGTWKGWTLARVPVADEAGFMSWVIGFGEDAMVKGPARVRRALVERLEATLGKGAPRPAKRKPPTKTKKPASGARKGKR